MAIRWERCPPVAMNGDEPSLPHCFPPAMHHVEPCHYYRFAKEGESREDYALRTAQSLEDKILQLGLKL